MVGRLWPAAAIALVYLWAFPYFGKLRSANELPRVLMTEEIVDHGTFKLDARLGELGSRFDIAETPDHHFYPNKAPGPSLLGVPVYAALRVFVKHPSLRAATWALRVGAVTVPCLVFLWWFWAAAARFAPNDGARRQTLVAYAIGSMALPYGILFFSHALAAACAGGAFVAAMRIARGEAKRPDAAAAVCGALAGASVLVDYQSLLAAAAVGVYLIVRVRKLRVAAIAGAAAAVPMALLLFYQWKCFGSPLRTGYAFAADPAHKQGVLGIIGPNGPAAYNALVAPDNGLIVLMPWALLAVLGAVVVARDAALRARVGAEIIVCGAVAAAYVLFVSSLVPEFGRAGWSVGPRYIGVAMPFLAWCAAPGIAWCAARPAPRALAGGLVVAGAIVMVAAAATYPHWPTSFKNPLYEVGFHALRRDLAPHSIGTALGLPGVWSLAPMFAAAAALVVWALGVSTRRLAISAAAACVVGVLIVAAYSRFPATGKSGERPWAFVVSSWEP
jgi:hypothetical protein